MLSDKYFWLCSLLLSGICFILSSLCKDFELPATSDILDTIGGFFGLLDNCAILSIKVTIVIDFVSFNFISLGHNLLNIKAKKD